MKNLFLISLTSGFVAINISAAELTISSHDLPRVPPTEPSKVLSTFRVKQGFRLDLVAAEPLVADPVAMAFDENGRLFVVEMRDYSERRDERLGRIRLLEDTDGDGHFDKSAVYAENLPWPTAVICWRGGIFVGATPDIFYLKDTNGDEVADTREVAFSGFGNAMERLNVQQLLNSFTWGLDNRIHGATGGNAGVISSPKRPNDKPLELRGRDFSFDPRTFEIRAETGGGQHGMSFDDYGRKFVCSNSAHIQMLMYEEVFASRNPAYPMPRPLVDIAADGPAAEVFRISPEEPWRVIRTKWRVHGKVPGPIEGGGRASGYFTAATGVTIYRGNAFPAEYRGDAFIADCGSNLIHRKKLYPDGVSLVARRPDDEQQVEFIASSDTWFRPVQFANAPDGTLYVADMYRETIEHPWSLPEPLKSHLNLNSGNDRGRIYRIVPEGFRQPPLPRLGSASTAELVQALQHENGWRRDTAARLLYERQDQPVIPVLRTQLQSSAPGAVHSLYALAGLGALNETSILHVMTNVRPEVQRHGVRMIPRIASANREVSEQIWKQLNAAARHGDATVRHQVALTVGELNGPEQSEILSTMASLFRHSSDNVGDRWIRAAIFSSLPEDATEFTKRIFAEPISRRTSRQLSLAEIQENQDFLRDFIACLASRRREPELVELLDFLEKQSADPDRAELAFKFATGLASRLTMAPRALDTTLQSGRRLQELSRRAAGHANDFSRSDFERAAATGLLAALPWPEAQAALKPLLKTGQAESVRLAAFATIARFDEKEANEWIAASWSQLTPRVRAEFLASALSRPARTTCLLDAIQAGRIQSTDLSSTQLDQLRKHRDGPVRERAQKLLPPAPDSRAEAVSTFATALDLDGNAARGRAIFTERCASCHRLNGEGQLVGPDLASAKSSGKPKLLAGIIDPNREVPPNFFNYIIDTKSGESLSGIITSESDASVTLRRAYGEESVVSRANIQRIQSSSLSLMPEGLEAGLSAQQMADLLEFVVAGEGK